MESYITDTQLVEGLFGALSWAIYWLYLRDLLTLSAYFETAIAWILVWLTRKFGLSAYLTIKKRRNIIDRKFRILPYPSIIM